MKTHAKDFWQFIKFGLVGISNTIVSYAVYCISYYLFHTNVYVANILGFIISVLNAYIWQSLFVFNSKEQEREHKQPWWRVLLKTYAAYAFSGLFLSELFLFLWLDVIHISKYLEPISAWITGMGIVLTAKEAAVSIAPFLNMIFTIPINFCINKFWVYNKKK